jgi:cell pole-organizing protein PopZ
MSEPNVQEPTMEEILASIRRIISEDEPAAEAAPAEALAPEPEPEPVAEAAPAVEAEEVLELTDPLPDPEPAAVETHGDLEVHRAEPEPEPEPVRAPEPVAAAAYDDEPLVSEPTADETASSFGHLARSVAMPKAGRNLEDVVAELLRPLLKAWLDEHLPAIVQAKVEEEVERIARRRAS